MLNGDVNMIQTNKDRGLISNETVPKGRVKNTFCAFRMNNDIINVKYIYFMSSVEFHVIQCSCVQCSRRHDNISVLQERYL